jgi:hypothetical protein
VGKKVFYAGGRNGIRQQTAPAMVLINLVFIYLT